MHTKETTQTMEKRTWRRDERILFERASDPAVFYDIVNRLDAEHKCVHVTVMGESVMGRSIPIITLGEHRESRGVLYVGGMHGTDLYTPAVLLRFVRDYADYLEAGKRIYSVSMPYLYASRTIHVVPMLNPDGYAIRRVGVSDIPIGDRLTEQNGGGDFSGWQYNARGIDLAENFCHIGAVPETAGLRAESEPEVSALCRYIRMAENGVIGQLELGMELHTDGTSMRCVSGDVTAPRSKTIARLLSRMTGCMPEKDSDTGGSLTDFFLHEIGRPAFSCGCLDDGGKESGSAADEYLRIYAAFREALFSAPLLI